MAKEKPKKSEWICVSDVGAVVPTESGGSKSLKRGDSLDGEYYEQIAPHVQGLIRAEDLDEGFKAQLEKERRFRTGESVPEEYAKAKMGQVDDFDPRFDKPLGEAAENLGQVIQEQTGQAHRDRARLQPSAKPKQS